MTRAMVMLTLLGSLGGCLLDRMGTGDSNATVDASDVTEVDAGPAQGDAGDDVLRPDSAAPDAGGSDAGPGRLAPGHALEFDGWNDYVQLVRMVEDSFTLEAWIQTTDSRDGSQFYHGHGLIYCDASGESDDFGTSILNERFAFGVGAPDTTLQSATIVTTGEWVHVAAVRDGSTGLIRVVINGTTESMLMARNRNDLDATTDLVIGGNRRDDRFFEGLIDEVRVWDVAHSDEQIRALMNRSLSGDESGLVGYWRFDEGDGNTAGDSSPTGFDGELGGGTGFRRPTWVDSTAPIYE